jgi:hypothetical protein
MGSQRPSVRWNSQPCGVLSSARVGRTWPARTLVSGVHGTPLGPSGSTPWPSSRGTGRPRSSKNPSAATLRASLATPSHG